MKVCKHDIPHIWQRFDWDCGVTCVLMLLSEDQRNGFLDKFSQICLEEGFKHNTWTIDLCYLLRRYNIRHSMYTLNQGVNVNRSSSIEEAERVHNRFKNAHLYDIKVTDGALSVQKLITHIVTTGPAIVLVDAALLSCDLCKYNKFNSEIRRMFRGAYKGHFVVVVGWCSGKLLYRDPARRYAVCATSPRRFQNARQAQGTDLDTILIYKDYS